MESNPYVTSVETPPPPGAANSGLAIASLVLGILAVLSSLFLIGALLGVIGAILGFAHIFDKRGRNTMAWCGIALSAFGVVSSVVMGIIYVQLLSGVASSSNEIVLRWEGVRAPEISVRTLDGRTVALSDLRGKRVILDFWATWCGPCVMEIPHFIRLHDETSRDDLVIVGVSQEKIETLQKFVAARGVNYPIARPTSLVSPYRDIHAIPTTFFIDRKGVIQRVLVGSQPFEKLKALALAEDYEGMPESEPGLKTGDE